MPAAVLLREGALIHHFNKSSHGSAGDNTAPAANRMAGAGSLMRAPDAIVTVTRIPPDHYDRYGLSDDELNLMVSATLRTQRDLDSFIIARASHSHDFRRLPVDVRLANASTSRKSKGGRKATHSPEKLQTLLLTGGRMSRANFKRYCSDHGGPEGGSFDRHFDAAIQAHLIRQSGDMVEALKPEISAASQPA